MTSGSESFTKVSNDFLNRIILFRRYVTSAVDSRSLVNLRTNKRPICHLSHVYDRILKLEAKYTVRPVLLLLQLEIFRLQSTVPDIIQEHVLLADVLHMLPCMCHMPSYSY